MTNRDWTLSVSELRRRLGLERLVVLNDFAALALALPALVPDELSKVGGGQAVGDAPVALIGPGTGLGVSALVSAHAVSLPIAGEGGHVTIGAADAGEDRIVSCLRGWFGHVSAERVLSVGGWIAHSHFRERFESKGRCRPYLSNIPTWVISSAAAPALRGANRALDDAPPDALVASAH